MMGEHKMEKTITIVDDDPGIQDSISLIFTGGYKVIVYRDAVPIIKGTPAVPDIFLIDKQLPGIDGLDLCRYLKGRPQTAHVPVIVMSASPSVAQLARSAGADMFIEKPCTIKQLRDAVSQLTTH